MTIEITQLLAETSYVLNYTLTQCNHVFSQATIPFTTDVDGAFSYFMQETNQGDLDLIWSVSDVDGNVVDTGTGVKPGTYNTADCCEDKMKIPLTNFDLIFTPPTIPDFVIPEDKLECLMNRACSILASFDAGVLNADNLAHAEKQELINRLEAERNLAIESYTNTVNSEMGNFITLQNKKIADICMKLEEIFKMIPGETV